MDRTTPPTSASGSSEAPRLDRPLFQARSSKACHYDPPVFLPANFYREGQLVASVSSDGLLQEFHESGALRSRVAFSPVLFGSSVDRRPGLVDNYDAQGNNLCFYDEAGAPLLEARVLNQNAVRVDGALARMTLPREWLDFCAVRVRSGFSGDLPVPVLQGPPPTDRAEWFNARAPVNTGLLAALARRTSLNE